ncbi:hypothetical protein M5689_019257 [Euphorbia peplus]|nr:hypothetical protein M5689_019257 [Euphorbia peplus]
MTLRNGLSHNRNLVLHCKSNDDDLGIQNLSRDQNFTWTFRPNIFGTTLFWCYAAPDDLKTHANFDVYKLDYVHDDTILFCDQGDVDTCVWVAKDDGIHLEDSSDSSFTLFLCPWIPNNR